MKLVKPMLPTFVLELPTGKEWMYEVKYDGFRTIVYLDQNDIQLVSRNLHRLNEKFPEVVAFFEQQQLKTSFPVILDGELCVLESTIKANFDKIQTRGRLKNKDKINEAAKSTPVSYVIFDLLMEKGKWLTTKPLTERKELLNKLIKRLETDNVTMVQPTDDKDTLWTKITHEHGEGIIAKQKNSRWQEGIRSTQWLKMKNMKVASFFIIGYDEANSFFHIGCLRNGVPLLIGKVGQGFSKEEKEALIEIVMKNHSKKVKSIYYLNPRICIEVEFLEMSRNEVRHPKFRRFRFDKQWEDCLWEAIPKG